MRVAHVPCNHGGDIPGAQAAILPAQAGINGLSEREASHIGVFSLILGGKPDAARLLSAATLRHRPRDALVASTAATKPA